MFLLLPLAVIALIVWLVSRARAQRAGNHGQDHSPERGAAAVRRLFIYGLLLTTLVIGATGTIETVRELLDRSDDVRRANDQLAQGLAMAIIGLPAFGFLARAAMRSLTSSADERRSTGWMLYLDSALAISLVAAAVTAHPLLLGLIGGRDFESVDVVAPVVWVAVWALHWFGFRSRHGVHGDLDLASGSSLGLGMLVIGAAGAAAVLLGELYDTLADDGLHDGDVREWAATTALGLAIWGWYWWGHYRDARRTNLWHVVALLLGALGGLSMAIAGAAATGYWALVWLVGDRGGDTAAEHFTNVPSALGIAGVGLATWVYHRWEFGRLGDVERTDPIRAYDHLMAGAGLVSTLTGSTVAVVALIEAVTPEPEFPGEGLDDPLVLAVVLAMIGLPVWGLVWRRIQTHLRRDPRGELASPVRRVYLITLFGIGGLVVLVSGLVVLIRVLEDVLDGSFGGETIRAVRVGVGLLVTVTGVAGYHLAVFGSDRAAIAEMDLEPQRRSVRVTVIAPADSVLPEQLAAADLTVRHWPATTGSVASVDSAEIEQLVAEIRSAGEATGLVAVIATAAPCEVLGLAAEQPASVRSAVAAT